MSALTCKCVGCGHKETFAPIPASASNELPMCPKCFSPMVAESVLIRKERVA